MKKEYLLFAFVVTIAACTPTEGVSNADPFLGGTDGLIIDFLENRPPREVTDDKSFEFDIALNIRNEGESDVLTNQANVKVTGLFPADFKVAANSLTNLKLPDALQGRQKDSEGNELPGGITEVEVRNLEYQHQLEGNLEFPVRAEVCYQYQTRAVAQYCILSDLLDTSDAVCEVSGTKTIHSSGAPLQVEFFKQSISGRDRLLYEFRVSHNGNGNVFVPANGQCGESSSGGRSQAYRNENRIKVTVDAGLTGLSCNSLSGHTGSGTAVTGELRLSGGSGAFTCIQDLTQHSIDSVKQLRVTLDYDYLETKSTSLLVKHLPS